MTETVAREGLTATSPKAQFLDALKREHATTLKVMRAYPASESELRPHPTSRSARELAFVFTLNEGMIATVLSGPLQFPPQFPSTPATWEGVIDAFEQTHTKAVDIVQGTPEDQLMESVTFPIGKNQMADVPKMQVLWMMLMDQVHHRGQLSVYLRKTGSKVPSIYGPSGDEPWF
jgi:uncharacterized damage-inducible protein DinB